MDIDPKMPLDQVDHIIMEFLWLTKKTQRTHAETMRLVARGGYLSALRDSLQKRLEDGWVFLNEHPENVPAATLWFGILERYENMCEALNRSPIDVVEAGKHIFKGERV